MSGADIPYQLRPNKFVDRQIFIELLSRVLSPRNLDKYIYVSMGGRHLIDHHAIYNRLGIEALYSFDINSNEVARQKINRPVGGMTCVEMNSADLPSKIDSILNRYRSKKNLIVWLDYTSPDRRTQFQEALQTLIRLRHGDIFRITLNANPRTLNAERWKEEGQVGPGEYRAALLRSQISEYMPTDIVTIQREELYTSLARCFQLVASAAEAAEPSIRFIPLLITYYSDGTPMLTITCAARSIKSNEEFPASPFQKWKFACAGWTEITSIQTPLLSLKEQYRLDANLHRGARRMLSSLRFSPAETDDQSLAAIKSYRSLHRYYPTFRHVDE